MQWQIEVAKKDICTCGLVVVTTVKCFQDGIGSKSLTDSLFIALMLIYSAGVSTKNNVKKMFALNWGEKKIFAKAKKLESSKVRSEGNQFS